MQQTLMPAPSVLPDQIRDYRDIQYRYLKTLSNNNTRDLYKRNIDRFFQLIGKEDLGTISGDDFLKFKSWIDQEIQNRDNGTGGYANDTIRVLVYSVTGFFNWSYIFQFTSHLDPRAIRKILGGLPRPKELSPRSILEKDEALQLLSVIENPRDYNIIFFALESGLRVTELCDLRCGDVYKAGKKFWVHVTRGKGRKEREVDIPKEVFQKIQEYVKATGRRLSGKKHLFLSRKGGGLSRIQIYRLIADYTAKAKLGKSVSPHSLRHTYGHNQRKMGIPLEVVSRRLGHASIETTKRYTRPAELEAGIEARSWLFDM